jgi:hypothetical protein
MPPAATESRTEEARAHGLPGLGVAALAVAALLLHAWRYRLYFADDAFISLRYAQRLLEGKGLTWTDGEAVEGYSNLLWTLLCAAGGALGLELSDAARALGTICGTTALLSLALHARPRRAGSAELAAAAIPALGLAGSASLAAWMAGGLEASLVAALVSVAAAIALRETRELGRSTHPTTRSGRGLALGAPLALLCWTRPDGLLFALGFSAGIFISAPRVRDSRRVAFGRLALPALAVMIQLAFRVAYYDALAPNTAGAKLAFSFARVREGLAYVASGLGLHAGVAIPATAAWLVAASRARRDPALCVLLVPAALWCSYVVMIGGDGFPAYRHLAPVAVLLAYLLAEGLRAARSVSQRGARLAAGTALAGLALHGWLQWRAPETQRVFADLWTRDAEVVGRLLGSAFSEEQPLLAVDPAGAVPYYSKLPALDMLGLTDRAIAANPPSDFGSGWLGHELGDGAYVLSREPDLLLFCRPAGGARPCFRSGVELAADPLFAENYRLVRLRGSTPHRFDTRIWARFEGGRIGAKRSADAIEIPAWFLSSKRTTPAELGAGGRLELALPAGERASLRRVALPPGSYALRASAGDARLEIEAWISGEERDGTPIFAGRLPLQFAIAEPRLVDLVLSARAEGEAARVERLRFERVPAAELDSGRAARAPRAAPPSGR